MVDGGRRQELRLGLKEIVAEYESRGVDLTADPRLAEAILLDSFPESPAEIRALVEGIRSGAIQYMRDRSGQGAEFSIGGSTSQLIESAGLRDDLARWAAESWWTALSLGELPVAPNPSTPPMPPPPPSAQTRMPPGPPPAPPRPPEGPPQGAPQQSPPPSAPSPTPPSGPQARPAQGAPRQPQPAGSVAATGQFSPPPQRQGPPQSTGAPAQSPGGYTAPGQAPQAPTQGRPQPTQGLPPQGFSQGPTNAPPSQAMSQGPTQAPPPNFPPQPGMAGAVPMGPQTTGMQPTVSPNTGPYSVQYQQGSPQAPTKRRSGRLVVTGVVLVAVLYLVIAAVAGIAPFKSSPHKTVTSTNPPTNYSQLLESRIPNNQTCFSATSASLKDELPNAKAAFICTPVANGPEVAYVVYATASIAETEFQGAIGRLSADTLNAGDCSTSDNVIGTYNYSSKLAGKLACFVSSNDEQYLLWLHYSDNILAITNGAAGDEPTLLQDFEHFGPS